MYTSYSTLSLRQRGNDMPALAQELLRTLQQSTLVMRSEVPDLMRVSDEMADKLVNALVTTGELEIRPVRGVDALVPRPNAMKA